MAVVTLGVDVGQRVDPSAICVAELVPAPLVQVERPSVYGTGLTVALEVPDGALPTWEIRYLSRLPLGTSYPAVAERVAEIAEGASRQKPDTHLRMRVDATGVGRPATELIVGALKRREVECPVEFTVFTFGTHMSRVGGETRVGKAFLVSRLQALLQTGRLRLPRTHEAAELGQELLNYEIRVDPDGDAKFGAFRTGSHDDLATALGLAVLTDPREGQTEVIANPWARRQGDGTAAARAGLNRRQTWRG